MGLFDKVGKWFGDRLGLNPPKVTPPVLDANKYQANADLLQFARDAFGQWRGSGAADPSAMTFEPMQRVESTVSGGWAGYDPMRMKLAYDANTAGMDTARDEAVQKSRDFYAGRNMLRSTPGMAAEGRIRQSYDTEKQRARNQLELADITEGERQRQQDIVRKEQFGQNKYDRLLSVMRMLQQQAGGSQFDPQSLIDTANSERKRAEWTSPIDTFTKVAGAFGYGF